MTLKECLEIAIGAGLPVTFLAAKTSRSSSTIYKWLSGARTPSEEVQNEIKAALKEIKAEWDRIELE